MNTPRQLAEAIWDDIDGHLFPQTGLLDQTADTKEEILTKWTALIDEFVGPTLAIAAKSLEVNGRLLRALTNRLDPAAKSTQELSKLVDDFEKFIAAANGEPPCSSPSAPGTPST